MTIIRVCEDRINTNTFDITFTRMCCQHCTVYHVKKLLRIVQSTTLSTNDFIDEDGFYGLS